MQPVELTGIRSKSILNEPGSYPVIYRAIDQAGNTTEIEAVVTVLTFWSILSWSGAEARQVPGRILDDAMTPRDRAYAIYRYVHDSIKYIDIRINHPEDNGRPMTDWSAVMAIALPIYATSACSRMKRVSKICRFSAWKGSSVPITTGI
jgi:hypothetical protein